MMYEFPIGPDPTEIFLRGEGDIEDQLMEWLETNTPDYSFIERQGMIVAIKFEKEKEAMLYKMVWEVKK